MYLLTGSLRSVKIPNFAQCCRQVVAVCCIGRITLYGLHVHESRGGKYAHQNQDLSEHETEETLDASRARKYRVKLQLNTKFSGISLESVTTKNHSLVIHQDEIAREVKAACVLCEPPGSFYLNNRLALMLAVISKEASEAAGKSTHERVFTLTSSYSSMALVHWPPLKYSFPLSFASSPFCGSTYLACHAQHETMNNEGEINVNSEADCSRALALMRSTEQGRLP